MCVCACVCSSGRHKGVDVSQGGRKGSRPGRSGAVSRRLAVAKWRVRE